MKSMSCMEIILIVTNIITCFSTFKIMQLTTKQTNIAKQKRDDDLFQIRLDTYNKIISFCADVVIKYDRLREHYSNRHEVGSHMAKKEIGKVLLAQVEYLFSKQVAQWLKNTCKGNVTLSGFKLFSLYIFFLYGVKNI